MTLAAVDPADIKRPVAHGDDWLTREELAAITPEVLAERTKDLRSLLAANARKAEELRQPVDEVWNALRASGIFYHFVPRRFGGLEFGLDTFIDVMLPLAAGCTSTAWVAAFCVEHNWLLSQFPKQAQEEIFGTFPYVIAPGATTPPGAAVVANGGYRLSGRWRWGTCVMHADWAMLAAVTQGEPDGPKGVFCILPVSEISVVDTWHMDGMIGTGSNDIVVQDVFVPAHRVTSLEAVRAGRGTGAELYESPIYRMPMLPFLALTAAIPAVGTALAAVELFKANMNQRTVYGSESKHVEKPAAQMRLAHADVVSRAAELQLRGAARNIEALAKRQAECTTEERAQLRADIAYAVQQSQEAITLVCKAAGSSAHQLQSPLQRALRDVNTIATHIVFDEDAVSEALGRAMLGMPPNTPLT